MSRDRKRTTTFIVGVIASLVAAAGSANATTSQAFKSEFDVALGVTLDHTYFCLDGKSACYSITILGDDTSKSGGTGVSGSTKRKSYHQRCLARARASNNRATACGLEAFAYGVDGVCHQHTNRGQMSMHGTFMNPDNITGGWWSYAAFGAYGVTYAATCLPWSEAQCAFSW